MVGLQKLKIKVPYNPTIPLLGIYQKELKTGSLRDICTPMFTAIIHNSQKVEATQVSADGSMDKQSVIYTYSGVLFSLKKEGNSAICYNVDDSEDILLR